MTADVATPQPLRALAIANRRKSARAAAKRELAALPMVASLRCAAAHIADPPEHLQTMAIDELLRSCRWIRHRRAATIRGRRIPPLKRLGALSEEERRLLIASIEDWIARSHSRGAVEPRRAA